MSAVAVDSDIDCEFSNDGENWSVGSIDVLSNGGYSYGFREIWYKRCRPRMNHPMVLTQEQVDLIPDDFIFSRQIHSNISIVEFTGILPMACWPWEVNNA